MCKCSRCAVFWCYTTVAWRRMKLHLEIKILNQEDLYFIFLQHWNLLLPLWNNNTGMLFRCCTCPTSLDIMAPPAAGKQDCTSTILYCSPVSNSDLQYLVNWCICDSLPVSLDCVCTPIIAKNSLFRFYHDVTHLSLLFPHFLGSIRHELTGSHCKVYPLPAVALPIPQPPLRAVICDPGELYSG